MRRGRAPSRASRAAANADDAAKTSSRGGLLVAAPLLFLAVGVVFVVSTLYTPPPRAILPANTMELRALVREQNATIRALARRVAHASEVRDTHAQRVDAHADRVERALAAKIVAEMELVVARADAAAARKDAQEARARLREAHRAPVAPHAPKRTIATRAATKCDDLFGEGLIRSYRASKQVWCSGASEITCYEHAYAHNGRVGHFCRATNILVDFAKVKGAAHHKKPRRGPDMYHAFAPGVLAAKCQKTPHWQVRKAMPHVGPMLRQLEEVRAFPQDVERVTAPTYLLARDEDSENMFHSTADHLNAFLVSEVLESSRDNWQTVLFDRMPDGPFASLIERTFSPKNKLKRSQDYAGKKVVFDELIFHLESPAGIVFPKVAGPKGVMTCTASSLWLGFRAAVLQGFGLLDTPALQVPHAVLSVRRRTGGKNTGRVFADEAALTRVLKEGSAMTSEVVDLGSLPFDRQIALMRRTNILIGAHGAGLMHVLFLAEEAVLLEIHPSYRLDRHFRLAARMAGKLYLPLRSTEPVTCQGTSDAIPVSERDFRAALDAAVRLARSFDDGVAECGLICDARVLALDAGNARFLPAGARAMSTRFPCGG
jgi:protein O-GlcNAc transferase